MNSINNALPLTPSEHAQLIAAITAGNEDHAPLWLVKILLSIHPATLATLDVDHECAMGNFFDIAGAVNQKILKHGWSVSHQKSLTPFKNRFGQTSQMYLWGLYPIPQAITDPVSDKRESNHYTITRTRFKVGCFVIPVIYQPKPTA